MTTDEWVEEMMAADDVVFMTAYRAISELSNNRAQWDKCEGRRESLTRELENADTLKKNTALKLELSTARRELDALEKALATTQAAIATAYEEYERVNAVAESKERSQIPLASAQHEHYGIGIRT